MELGLVLFSQDCLSGYIEEHLLTVTMCFVGIKQPLLTIQEIRVRNI